MWDELEKKIKQHFTPAEFVDFLEIKIEDIIDYCHGTGILDLRYGEIASEVCFEFNTDGEETSQNRYVVVARL